MRHTRRVRGSQEAHVWNAVSLVQSVSSMSMAACFLDSVMSGRKTAGGRREAGARLSHSLPPRTTRAGGDAPCSVPRPPFASCSRCHCARTAASSAGEAPARPMTFTPGAPRQTAGRLAVRSSRRAEEQRIGGAVERDGRKVRHNLRVVVLWLRRQRLLHVLVIFEFLRFTHCGVDESREATLLRKKKKKKTFCGRLVATMYDVLRYACRALRRRAVSPARTLSLNGLPDEVMLLIAELLTPEHALPTASACKAWCRAVTAASTFAVGAGLRFATLDDALRLAPAFATLLLHELFESDSELVLSKDVRLKGAAGMLPSATVLPSIRADGVHVALQNLTVSGAGKMRSLFCEAAHVTAKAVHILMHEHSGNTLWRWAVMATQSRVGLEDCVVVCTHADAADVEPETGEAVPLHTVHGAIGVCGNEYSSISL